MSVSLPEAGRCAGDEVRRVPHLCFFVGMVVDIRCRRQRIFYTLRGVRRFLR